jgi:nucleoside-diphosphate-sugar epimerase
MVGQEVAQQLQAGGFEVRGFDLITGDDVRNAGQVLQAMEGCATVVHLAAADEPAPAATIIDTNVLGTHSILRAALATGVNRVVLVSSTEALGVFMGEAAPAYLPLDDDHPATPTRPYGASKRAAEQLAERVSAATGLEVICLRPPGVCDDQTRQAIRDLRADRASYEWDPIWEYSAWIHVEDLAAAVVAASTCPMGAISFACLLVAACDTNSDRYSGVELARRVHPDVEWRGGYVYELDATRSLIDSRPAQDLLRWEPTIRWRSMPD